MIPKRQLKKNPQNSDILPDELWQFIGYKLSGTDRIRFRAVCKAWMSLIPSRMPPWLILPEPEQIDNQEAEGAEDPNQSAWNPKPNPPPRGFVCLGEQSIYEWDFPELLQSRCVGSSGNWLVTLHKDASLRLLNPFDRQLINLPSALLFDEAVVDEISKEYDVDEIELWKVILNCSPSNPQDCVAMAIHHHNRHLAFARLGDHKWTTVDVRGKSISKIDDVIFYKHQYYAISNCGELLVCDLGDGVEPPKVSFLTSEPSRFYNLNRINYLVEWLGELLMVHRSLGTFESKSTYTPPFKIQTREFEIQKFDFAKIQKFDFAGRNGSEVKSLGEHSLFLGLNASVSVSASDYFGLVEKNCVYFTDNFEFAARTLRYPLGFIVSVGHDMGVYDFRDQCIRPHFRGASTSTSRFSPPVWIVPPEKGSAFGNNYLRNTGAC